MGLINIPAYLYFQGSTVPNVIDVQLYTSDFLINKAKQLQPGQTESYTIYNPSGITEDIAAAANNWLGEYIFTPKLKLYNGFINGETPSAFDAALVGVQYLNVTHGYIPTSSGHTTVSEVKGVNSKNIGMWTGNNAGLFFPTAGNRLSGGAVPTYYLMDFNIRPVSTHMSATIDLEVYPEDIISNGTFNSEKYTPGTDAYQFCCTHVIFNIDYVFDTYTAEFYATYMSVNYTAIDGTAGADAKGAYLLFSEDFTTEGALVTEIDTENPYAQGGQSGTGGGDGVYGGIDDVDGTDIPALPTVSATDLGFITIYNPSKTQLKNLSSFMWSNLFDLDTYKKLFSDPMQSVIGLAIVPVAPTIAGSKNVTFGGIDSGVNMSYLSTQYVQFNCGSVTIDKYVGSFLDYAPYTKISIYLPYIGIHELSPDDIMGDTIQVVYNIDVLSGACGCFIKSSSKGVLYSYNGSCISNIPLTSINFSTAIQNAVSAVCSGAAIVAGVASGAAPVTAMGAVGLLGSAANTAINSKPTVQRSGSLGGSAGVLSVQKPYIIIERPNYSVPGNVNKYVGQSSNITEYLGNLSGFTMVEYVHLQGIPATDEEIQEIEALLKEGVIL